MDTAAPEGRDSGILHVDSKRMPGSRWRGWLIGRPLPTADAPHQTIGKGIGLAVFASDALSSTAYATQELMAVLAVAGTIAFGYAFPITLAIIALLAIVTLSYEQTIHAYPSGGGAYTVARDNIGELAALTAAAALLTDYVLTVAVSISSGVAQIVSAFPALAPDRVLLSVLMVLFVTMVNLRGVRESGRLFAIPTYFFVAMMLVTFVAAFARYLAGTLGSVPSPPPMPEGELVPITAFLILHAFANGTSALTGTEAISNGITAFREPRSRNAGITLLWMAVILGTMVLAVTFLAVAVGAVPSEAETVISQIARTAFGSRGLAYLATIAATTVILVMAANTAFAGFPRLAALTATDGFLPRQLTFRGSRLVYSRGIVLLAAIACLLIVLFRASVSALIPLYAIGVFLSFTLSQAGMSRRWRKSGRLRPGETVEERGSRLQYDRRWRVKMVANGFGALCTAVVMVVFAVTKFAEGAWIVLVLLPVLVAVFFAIHRHYATLARSLSLEDYSVATRHGARHRVILCVAGVNRGTVEALAYARSLSDDVTAVHISIDPDEAEQVMQRWELWGQGTRLVVVQSPYRLLLEPLLDYINQVATRRRPGEVITVVVPQFVPESWWANALHMQTAFFLRAALLGRRGIVITEVPYQIAPEPPA